MTSGRTRGRLKDLRTWSTPPRGNCRATWTPRPSGNCSWQERARHAAELEERDRKIAAHEGARASDHEEIARLSRIIRDLQRTTFGARSEKLDPEQLALALEDLEQELAAAEVRLATPAEKAASAANGEPTEARCQRTCRGSSR